MRLHGHTVNPPPTATTRGGPRSLGTLLAQLGGGDPQILPLVPSAKGRFIQMGLVLLSTATLAVISMAFLLVDALRASWWVAVPLGLAWGFVIINLDRMLIQNIRPTSGFWRTVWIVLPRLVVAVLLGLVVATPLVLRVFDSEIKAEMQVTNARKANDLGTTRSDSPEAKRLAEVKTRIETNEGILAGNLPGLTSPNVQTATERLTKAEEDLEKKRKTANDAYDAMICELDGRRCREASGKPGAGQRYQALKRLYDVALADLKSAEQAVTAARNALGQANKEAATANTAKLKEAQDRARAELPGLVKERDALQQVINTTGLEDGRVQADNTGLLARLEALERLGDASSMAGWAHLAVAGLFFMIELLPVLVKLLTSMGPPSLYDRISELEEKSVYDDAIQRRNHDRRRIEGDSRKRRKIEEDMRDRETELGLKANAHVASEMEKILDVALRQWSAEVTNTLHGTPHPGGPAGTTAAPSAHANGSAPHPAGASPTPPSPADQAIRSRFNLPPRGTL